MPAEKLTQGTRTGAAMFKPALPALLRHLLVPQLPKPTIRVAVGLELARNGHCGMCADVERLNASADPQPQVTRSDLVHPHGPK